MYEAPQAPQETCMKKMSGCRQVLCLLFSPPRHTDVCTSEKLRHQISAVLNLDPLCSLREEKRGHWSSGPNEVFSTTNGLQSWASEHQLVLEEKSGSCEPCKSFNSRRWYRTCLETASKAFLKITKSSTHDEVVASLASADVGSPWRVSPSELL
jgi:hypothetical protein